MPAELIVSARVACSPARHTPPPNNSKRSPFCLVLGFITILVDLNHIKVQYAVAQIVPFITRPPNKQNIWLLL